jgi:hypothetical protein
MADTPNVYVKGSFDNATDHMATDNLIDARLEPEISSNITKIRPWETMFLYFLEQIQGKVRKTGQPEFTQQEESSLQYTATVATAANASTTSIVVGSAAHLVKWLILQNTRTGEQLRIESISSNTLTVATRPFGTTPPAAMLVGDTLMVLATALQEGSDAGHMRMRGTDSFTLYCQLIEHNFGMTDLTALRNYRGPTEDNRLAEQAAVEFKQMQQRAFLLGEPHKDTSDGLVTYATAGLRYFCRQRTDIDMLTALSYQSIAEALYTAARYSTAPKLMAFTSGKILMQLMPLMKEFIRTTKDDTTLGYEVEYIKFPGRRQVHLFALPELDEDGYNREILVTDLNVLEIREFEPLRSQQIRKDTGAHRKDHQLFCRRGLGCSSMWKCARLYNIGN